MKTVKNLQDLSFEEAGKIIKNVVNELPDNYELVISSDGFARVTNDSGDQVLESSISDLPEKMGELKEVSVVKEWLDGAYFDQLTEDQIHKLFEVVKEF